MGQRNGREKFFPQNFKFITDARRGWKLILENFRLYGIFMLDNGKFLFALVLGECLKTLQKIKAKLGDGWTICTGPSIAKILLFRMMQIFDIVVLLHAYSDSIIRLFISHSIARMSFCYIVCMFRLGHTHVRAN